MRNCGDVAKGLSNFDWFTNLFLSHAALLIPSSHVHHSLLPRFSEDTAYPVHSGLRWCCFLLPPLSPWLSPPPAPHSHSLLTCPLYCFCICLIIIPASSRALHIWAPERAGFFYFLLNAAPTQRAETARGVK